MLIYDQRILIRLTLDSKVISVSFIKKLLVLPVTPENIVSQNKHVEMIIYFYFHCIDNV